MADNEVEIVFTGKDDVTPTINKILNEIGGTSSKQAFDISPEIAALNPDILNLVGGLEKVAEVEKKVEKQTEETNKSFLRFGKGGLAIGTKGIFTAAGAGLAVYAALKFVAKQLEEVSDLAEDQPELFTDRQLDAVQEYDASLAMLKDTLNEVKINILTGVMPAVTDMAFGLANTNEIRARTNELVSEGMGREQALTQATRELNEAARDTASGLLEYGESLEDAAEAAKLLSAENKVLLGNMFKIQDASDKFIEGEEKRAEKQKKLEEDKVRTVIETNEKISELENKIEKVREKGGKNVAEKVLDLEKKIADARTDMVIRNVENSEKLADLEKDGIEAIEDKEKATKKLIYTNLEAKAAQDGLISVEETKFLQDTAVQMGLIDREAAAMAIGIAEAADAMWEQFQKPGEAVQDVQDLLNRVVQGGPYRTQLIVETVMSGNFNETRTFGAAAKNSATYGATGRGANLNYLTQEVTKRQTTGRH